MNRPKRKWSTKRSLGFIEVLLDTGEMNACLEARLKIITRTGGQTKTDSKTLSLMPQPEPSGLKINLPKLQLPTFDGYIDRSFGMHLSHRLMNRSIYQTYLSLTT